MKITKLQLNSLWATSFLFVLALAQLTLAAWLCRNGIPPQVEVIYALTLGKMGYGAGIVYIAKYFAGANENGTNSLEGPRPAP